MSGRKELEKWRTAEEEFSRMRIEGKENLLKGRRGLLANETASDKRRLAARNIFKSNNRFFNSLAISITLKSAAGSR